jgi:predicted AlkP superfamily phosphohydrolase/phosphomutase
MAVHHPRILFLGIDAMDRDLVLQWAGAGILPTFRSLLERGASGPTLNPPGLYVGAVWPSFFTGVSPARHGRYCYEQIVTGTYAVQPFRPSNLKRLPFWDFLSSAGRRVAVVDVPKSPLGTDLNGVQLQDWGTHDPEPGCSFQTWPPPLAAELTARFGSEPVGDCNDIERTAAGIEAFCRNLKARIQAKTAICRELLDRESWDLFLAVFAESHCVGHQCWTLHDQAHPSHDPAVARAVGDPLKAIYAALDTAVADLLLKAGPDTTVIVLASHGMGPHFDATFMLDQILERLDPQPGALRRAAIRRCRRYWRALLRRVLRRPQPAVPPPVDHRRFFPVPNNEVHGAIRVNLVGREPRGRVRPGKEYDALFAELREALLELVNVHTGQPVVRDVLRSAHLYQGECLNDLPDFVVEWNREAPITCVSSPRIGTVRMTFDGVRSGDHKPEGFFWAAGPGIQAGRRCDLVSVMDFAPTVAALLEVSLPDVDGKPITAVLPAGAPSRDSQEA